MKNTLIASLFLVAVEAEAAKVTPAMSPEVYELIAGRVYWENSSNDDPVPQLDQCFEQGRAKGRSGSSLLRYLDSCMDGAGYEKKVLKEQA